jgi:hypothetical protein
MVTSSPTSAASGTAPSPVAPVIPVATVPVVAAGEGTEGREVAASCVSFLRISFLRCGLAAVSPPVAAVAAPEVAGLSPSAQNLSRCRLLVKAELVAYSCRHALAESS